MTKVQRRAKLVKVHSYTDQLRPYPEPVDVRSGCKVGWNIYLDRADAERCSEAARGNAKILANQGYDFGYCAPGSVTEIADGKLEVCIP